MIKKLFFLLFPVLLFPSLLFAQQTKIDSLLTLLKKDKEDTNKVIHLNLLSREYTNISSYDNAIQYSNNSLQLAEQLNFKGGIVVSYNNLGNVYKNKSDYPKALDYYLQGLKIEEELKNKKGIAGKLNNIGNVYSDQRDYPKALDYYSRALKINEEIGNKNWEAINLGNLGVVYHYQRDFRKSLEYYLKALKIAEELGDKIGIARHLGNIGNAYSELGKVEKSKVKKDSLLNKGLEYKFQSLKMHEELGEKDLIASVLGNIGSTYIDLNKYTNAEKYLLQAVALADSIGYLEATQTFNEYLSVLYSQTNRYRLALEHYKKAMVLKDTIFSEEKNKEITRKEMNYEFDKKEAAAKAEADKQAAVAEAEKKKQQVILWSVVSGLLIVVVFAGFVFRALRITQKQKQLIEQQKKIVEEKQNEILASIRYAKRIQDAILPTEKYIAKTLNRLNPPRP